MNKKGQVTVFVIVGLIILILASTYFGYRYFVTKNIFSQQRADLGRVPVEFQPVASYLDSCVERVAAQSLTVIGSQGGYLTLPNDPIPVSSITPIPKNLEVLPNTDFQVPLWFRESGRGIDEVNIPSKVQLEQNIAGYVTTHFAECVHNLTSFLEEGYTLVSVADVPKTTVSIQDEQVDVNVQFPLTFSFKGVEFELKNYLGHVPTQFGSLYSAAIEILNAENQGFFIENKTLDILIAYDNEIPFSGSDLSCSEKIWSKTEVSNRLKTVLFENVAAMKISGSNYELKNKDGEYLVFDAMKNKRKDVTVNLLYLPSWPSLVDITPSEGDILRSDPITKKTGALVTSILSSYFCLNNHHFIYTIKYPVLISLTDKNGFTFQFATEIILDRNLPRKNRLVPLTLPDEHSPLCDFPSAPLTVNTYTVNPGNQLLPLKNVDLSFKCFPESCPLGSVAGRSNTATVLAPPCVNGFIEGRKEGFFAGKAIVATNTKEQQHVDLVLEPIYEKKVQIKVIDKKTGEVRDPYSSELVSFEFRHKDTKFTTSINIQSPGASCQKEEDCGPGLECKKSTCFYPSCKKDEDCSSDQTCLKNTCKPKNVLKLLAGTYIIDSYISRTSTWPITTEKKVVEKCVDLGADGLLGFFFTKEKCFSTEIPSLNLKNALVGGGSFEFEFDREKLASDDPLILYILTDDLPADMEGFADIQTSLNNNKEHPSFRYPEL